MQVRGTIDCRVAHMTSGNISAIGATMALGKPLGRSKMHLRLPMVGTFTHRMANHGSSAQSPTPAAGAHPPGQVDRLGSPWVSRLCMQPILGHISSAPRITFLRAPVRESCLITSFVLNPVGMVEHCIRVWTMGPHGKSTGRTFPRSTMFNIGTMFNLHSTRNGSGMDPIRKGAVVPPTSHSPMLRATSLRSVDRM